MDFAPNHMRIARAAGLIAAATALLLLVSCATTAVMGGTELDGSEGYVSFYSDGMLLSITPIVNGQLGEELKNNGFFRMKQDFRVTCPPGPAEFIVRHQDFEERVRVNVATGMISFISYRQQVSGQDSYTTHSYGSYSGGTTTTTYYFVRSGFAADFIPADTAALDTGTLVTALSDPDWGVRHFVLDLLTHRDDPLDGDTVALVQRMSTEDAMWQIRQEAEGLLKSRKLPRPAPPLYRDNFENDVARAWGLGTEDDSGTSYGLTPAGYHVQVEEGWAGQKFRNVGVLGDRDEYRLVMEAEWLGGDETMAFGLLIGQGNMDFQLFGISANGGSVSVRYSGGEWGEPELGWTQAAEAEIASREVHRIEVERSGGNYRFFVDGVEIGTADLPALAAPGALGLYVGGPQQVVFRKILVY